MKHVITPPVVGVWVEISQRMTNNAWLSSLFMSSDCFVAVRNTPLRWRTGSKMRIAAISLLTNESKRYFVLSFRLTRRFPIVAASRWRLTLQGTEPRVSVLACRRTFGRTEPSRVISQVARNYSRAWQLAWKCHSCTASCRHTGVAFTMGCVVGFVKVRFASLSQLCMTKSPTVPGKCLNALNTSPLIFNEGNIFADLSRLSRSIFFAPPDKCAIQTRRCGLECVALRPRCVSGEQN